MKEEDPILGIKYNSFTKQVKITRDLKEKDIIATMLRSQIYKMFYHSKPSEVAEEILSNKQLKLL